MPFCMLVYQRRFFFNDNECNYQIDLAVYGRLDIRNMMPFLCKHFADYICIKILITCTDTYVSATAHLLLDYIFLNFIFVIDNNRSDFFVVSGGGEWQIIIYVYYLTSKTIFFYFAWNYLLLAIMQMHYTF